jgi:predicted DsbA family dithiol-disulfide isomerase
MRIAVDIYFDTVCPWCYVGKRRLEKALEDFEGVDVAPRWQSFLLNPDMPADGMDRTTHLVRKFGSESRVRRIYGAIADAGQSVEIDFAFDRIHKTPNSVPSHRLVRFAAAAGGADAAVEALFLEYFVNGRNIGDIEVLVDIGGRLGLAREPLAQFLHGGDGVEEILSGNARAHRMGINSVPTFVFDGKFAISGAHQPAVLRRMLEATRTAAALDRDLPPPPA